MSRHFRRSCGLILLAAAISVNSLFYHFTGSAADGNHAPTAPTALKTELLDSAYGINTKDPAFSWVVNDEDPDEVQTAYRIVVSESLADAGRGNWLTDTDWIYSSASTYVKVPALEALLQDNELYYWQVQTKDGSGEAGPLSEPAAFTTAVGEEWQSDDGIWIGSKNAEIYAKWKNYRVEATLTISSVALGLIFRSEDITHGYMWQFRADSNSLNPHIRNGGIWEEVDIVSLEPKGVTLEANSPFLVRIDVMQDKTVTYVDTTGTGSSFVKIDERVTDAYDRGAIGFRTGGSESGTADNVRVVALESDGSEGELLYQNDFSTACYQFANCTVASGALVIPRDLPDGGILDLTDDGSSGGTWSTYRLETTLTVREVALGVIFRAKDAGHCYMWQFSVKNNAVNPHIKENTWAQIESVPLAPQGITLEANKPFRVRIDVMQDKTVTYIDPTAAGTAYVKVDERATDRFTSGIIGFRTGGSESGTADDLRVAALLSDGSEGAVLYQNDFSTDVLDFPGCSAGGGVLSIPRNQGAGTLLSTEEMLQDKGNFVFLRSAVTVDSLQDVEKAILSVTAKSPEPTRQYVYNMYLNGQFVGLGPARYGKNILYYNTFDVTSLLTEGENVLGAINYTTSEKSFLCQLTLYYKDGTRQVLSNSGRDQAQWRSLDGTRIFGDNGSSIGTSYFTANSENLNGKLFPYGWNEAGYDDSDWLPVSTKGRINKNMELQPYDADNVGRYLYAPKIIDKIGEGVYWIDLGQEIIGGIRLTADSPESRSMTLYYGEEGNREAGTVQWNMNTGNRYKETWTLKAGQQTLENIGMKTFRYIRIENCPVELTAGNIQGLAMHQAFDEEESSFRSSDEMLNKIYALMKQTIKMTNQDLYVDSQSRERGAYEGDALINMLTAYAMEDDYTLARFSYEYLNTHPTWPAEYLLFSVEMQWLDYLYTGNSDSLRENYELLKDKLFPEAYDETMGLMGKPDRSGIRYLVDWPTTERDGYKYDESYYNTVFNAVACGAYRDMAQIAAVLGKTKDAADYSAIANRIRETMIEKMYNAEKGAFADGLTQDGTRVEHYAQHATAYPLSYQIFTDAEMSSRLTAFIAEQGEIRMSVYGAFFLLRGLYSADGGSVANAFLCSTDASEGKRTWAYMIDTLGATITTEAWNERNKSNMTYSHPWGSAPGSQIPQGLFGINPTKPGFEEFQIKLQPGELEEAAVKIPTLRGGIAVSFAQDLTSKALTAEVTVPVNSKAHVCLPAGDSRQDLVTVDGQTMQAVRKGSYLYLRLGSGTHSLSVDPTAEAQPLYLQAKPILLTYFVGDELDTEGLRMVIKSADGTAELVDNDACRYAYDFSQAGKAKVSVSYTDGEGIVHVNRFTVTVNEPPRVRQIVLASKPTKLFYDEGEELETDGLTVLAKYTDGSTEIIEADHLTVSGYDAATPGLQTLTVQFGDLAQTTAFTVRVNELLYA